MIVICSTFCKWCAKDFGWHDWETKNKFSYMTVIASDSKIVIY